MKNRRAILCFLSVLLVSAAAHLLVSYQAAAEKVSVVRQTLVSGSPESVSRVEIARGQEARSVLARSMGAWRLAEPYSALVDDRAVMKLLDAVATSQVEDSIGARELLGLGRVRGDFGLAPPRATLSVSWNGGSEIVSFGSSTPSGDGVYATVEGEDTVYVVASNLFAMVDVPPEGFRRRALFSVGEESVQALDIKRGSDSFMSFVRDGEMWRMVRPRESLASSMRIRRLLAGIMGATAVDFVWPTGARGEAGDATTAFLAGFGLDPESAVTVTVKCADGADRQLSFGNEAKNGLVYAFAQDAGAVVTLDAALKDASIAETSDFTDTRIFPFEESAITRISVTDADTSYLLARRDGGSWFLDSPVAAATDPDTVSALLARLLSLKTSDISASGLSVSLGTNAAPATVPRDVALGDMSLDSLRSREIIRIEPSAVKRIVVSDSSGGRLSAVVYDRDRRAWNVEAADSKGVVCTEALEALTASLCPLTAECVVKLKVSQADMRAAGLVHPRFTVAIDQFKEDAVRRNILVGDPAPGGGRYATLGAVDAVFVISAETAARLSARLVAEPGEQPSSTQKGDK